MRQFVVFSILLALSWGPARVCAAQTLPADAPEAPTPASAPAVAPAVAADDAEPLEAEPEAEAETLAARQAERAAKVRLEQVRANLEAVTEIIKIGLANDEAGQLLREARHRAPDFREIDRRIAARERQSADARLNSVRLLERRRLAEDPAEIQRLTNELATQEAYVAALDDALAAERELGRETGELVTLLDGRLLWIGSAPPIGSTWLADVGQGMQWVADPATWLEVARTLLHRLGETPVISVLITLLFAALLFSRMKLRSRFANLAEGVGKYATDSFVLTVRALIVTLLLALPLPVALAGVGGLLATQNIQPFAQALGNGLLAAAAVYLLLAFFRGMCRRDGLADVHFGWNDRARRTLLNNLSWLVLVEVSSALVVGTCDAGGEEIYRQGLGRLAFMVGSVGLTIFVARVFRPGSGVLSELMSRDGWAWRLRKGWYGLLVLLPAALTIAAAMGYYYTATEVLSRFFTTGVVVLTGIVIYSLFTRWLLVTRRHLAVKQARQKLAELREARQRKGGAEGTGTASGEAIPELETQTVDVEAASGQTLSLLRTLVAVLVFAALWAVWNDVLPALAVLKSVELTDATYDAADKTIVIVPAITLWSLLLGGVAAALTVVAARNLPAVLELVVLQRFPLDSGTRYAAATLTRYIVIAAGVLIASNLLGIDWSRAQWIIAALGVGLGFGLQEIVANFVSGLIILFERPVRVGDTVTVGDVSGTVSRLQIRATTITDWDNKEVLVPNKSFITDRVVNWTLSSPMTRLLIPVGIAYGSDVAKAHKAIGDAVKKIPAVLSEPAPSVFFLGFGDSSLDFEVRAFVPELSKRLPTLHELHSAIDAALRKADIEIPFPQRDLHLRSSDIGQLADPTANGQPVDRDRV